MKNLIFTKTLLAIIIGVVFLTSLLTFPAALKAQGADDTPEQVATPQESNPIQEKLREILKKQATKVESVLGELTNQRRGFIGQVVRVTEETLALEVRNATRIVPLNDAVSLMRSNTVIQPKNIEIGSWALVLGLMERDSFVAKKITFSQASLRPLPHVVYLGSVKAIKTNSLDFQPRGQETILTVTTNRNTVFQDSTGEEVILRKFVEDDQVLLIGYQENESTIMTVMRALAPFTRSE